MLVTHITAIGCAGREAMQVLKVQWLSRAHALPVNSIGPVLRIIRLRSTPEQIKASILVRRQLGARKYSLTTAPLCGQRILYYPPLGDSNIRTSCSATYIAPFIMTPHFFSIS